jgi:hypothetical protein
MRSLQSLPWTWRESLFRISTIAQMQINANALKSPNCNITELNLYLTHINSFELEQLNQTLVNSLQRNASLQILKLCLWNKQAC